MKGWRKIMVDIGGSASLLPKLPKCFVIPHSAVWFYYLIPGWNSCSPSGLSGTTGSEGLTTCYPHTFPWDREVCWGNWGTEAVGTPEGVQVIQAKPSRKLYLTCSNRKVWGCKLPSEVWWELVHTLLAEGRNSGTEWQSDGQWLPKVPHFWCSHTLQLVFPALFFLHSFCALEIFFKARRGI